MIKIFFRKSEINLIYHEKYSGLSLLIFAEENGLILPQGCLSGYCEACVAELVEGKVKLMDCGDIYQSGMITLCQAIPLADCIIDA